ncbi:hypothetical protein SSX86_024265 [Deinandra increscens subsp. villosa]|uniref:non-specific serine/threonine protein kinase n=1 Tax=Deinandra increscens subsp. villosa TaxID=3103831 RepID=A0AAP0CIY9_9ASTR
MAIVRDGDNAYSTDDEFSSSPPGYARFEAATPIHNSNPLPRFVPTIRPLGCNSLNDDLHPHNFLPPTGISQGTNNAPFDLARWPVVPVSTGPTTSLTATSASAIPMDALRVIGHTLKKDWDFTEDPCVDWVKHNDTGDGREDVVLCNCDSNGTICHVTSISLKGQSLVGTLPPEFTNLPNLLNINLARNNISGTIPSEWGSMGQILNISLVANLLNGQIPKEIGNISTLKILNLEDNMLSGTIPKELGDFTSIERLLLTSNSFTGELPASLANLNTIIEFRVGGNDFSGNIPEYIGQWQSLKILSIQGSGLEGPIPSSITLLASLSDLRISDLKGPDMLFPPFGNTTLLNTLILRSCNLFGKLPDSLPNSLKVLDLSFNKLSGRIPDGFNDLKATNYIYLTRNSLSGSVPDWMLTSGKNIDLSYNDFTPINTSNLSCQIRETNLFASFEKDNISKKSKEVSCLGNVVCPRYSSSLYINCGGKEMLVENKTYEGDLDSGGPSHYFSSTNNRSRWGFSNTGHFLDNDENAESFLVGNISSSGVEVTESQLYKSARTSALSLTYYGFCLLKGSYKVTLHFAEIVAPNDTTLLGRHVFDIYIQDNPVAKDFNIVDKAGAAMKEYDISYMVKVKASIKIRLNWAGKGTTNIPFRGTYGPIISAITIDRNLPGPKNNLLIGIMVGVVCFVILILGLLWWCGYLRRRDTMKLDLHGVELHGLELNTGSFTLRQIKIATNNFDVANKIGEGGFGSVYKGVLPNGTLIAVKQLSSKSKQGNREFLNELGMISALQHPHLVKLYGCCIEGNQLLLAYEYMENNSLARALFGPEKWQLELDWPTRYRICIGIARGLAFLHEESRLKIVHRDIKATNILLDKNLDAKISDFGLAKLDEEDTTHISTRVAGTFGYMAPEYALRGYLTDKADVYSYGIVLLEIISGIANTVDRANENQFILLNRAIALKATSNLTDLVDPRLGSEYDIPEMMVVINLALMCTTITPTDRPTMSYVVRMLEKRIVPEAFIAEQSRSLSEIDRHKMMKQLENKNENPMEGTSFAYTESSTSVVDLYPVDDFSEYLLKRESDAKKLLSEGAI